MTTKAFLKHEVYTDDFSLYMRDTAHDGRVSYLKSVTFEAGEPHDFREPILSHDLQMPVRDFAQAIMDAAWDAGLRPTGFADVKNETAAIRAHLTDMRQLVFAKLNVDKP